jgi:hypothetical protein
MSWSKALSFLTWIDLSDFCENVAIVAFGWKLPSLKIMLCPPPLDTFEHFGANVVDDIVSAGEETDDQCDLTSKLRSQ